MNQFCHIVQIPINTFQKYVRIVPNTRRIITDGVGHKPIIQKKEQKFVADITAWHDRANDGLKVCAVIERIQDLKPGMTKKQASNYFRLTLGKNNDDILKQKLVVAQGTTTQRNAVTVAQQYPWHCFTGSGLNFLCEKNIGTCKWCDKTFGKLIDHFIVGGDKTCIMAGKNVIKVVGSAGKKKDEITSNDSWDSIIMFWTGVASSTTGPTVF